MRCHCTGGARKLNDGIYQSCNTYFSSIYMKTINKYNSPSYAVDVWSNHLKSFGLGDFMGYDLPIGKRGKIPTSKTYKRLYPGWHWDSKTIVSNAIGQGEVLMTPIQLANLMAAVANRGYYYTPHIVKKIKGELLDKKFRTKHVTTIDRKHFEPVIEGMNAVYGPGGTASGLGLDGIEICGKTGTAENYLKVNGKRVKLQDHSIFVAFAPKVNPKIAIAVFVENGYWGKRWAGPITSLMIEKYLRKKITNVDFEKRMLEGSLKDQYNKLYPQKHQDSLSIMNSRIKDSIAKFKNGGESKEEKKDSNKKEN
jgi:penicillin-binding protein 2